MSNAKLLLFFKAQATKKNFYIAFYILPIEFYLYYTFLLLPTTKIHPNVFFVIRW